EEMWASGDRPEEIVARKGLAQISDASALEAAIDQILAENPKQVEGYRAGRVQLLGFFVGQVMRKTEGKANPALVNELLTKKLKG
ncbi:MAG: Asp-tRNA(Asn)/Glu-tRNA(Gln) amidotransferase GatCAB subunit B, partial [Deltaproteobacteria bacterium]|nr:Asp-tRNA(Asn)/Glu-tRNA(Gln) amidotransferase GatCAB subunit B [Deltaproteobacteria bacterium]